jgi:O-antigen/teichoic acid export membrane protein
LTLGALIARLTGIPRGQHTRELLVNLAYLVSTDALLSSVTFGLTAAVVRVLGPGEFGQVNLVVSVGQLWLTLLLFGLHVATPRYIAAEPDRAGAVISTALVASLLFGVALVPVLVVVRDLAQQRLGVSSMVFLWSVALAYSLVPQQLTSGMLAGQHRFRSISRCNLASGLVFAVVIAVLLVRTGPITVGEVIAANMVRALLFSALALGAVYRVMRAPSLALGRQLLGFGSYYTGAAVAHLLILGSIDNLMLNAYHGERAVGLYGAYYVPFNIFAGRIVKFASDVLMPAMAAHADRARLLRQAAPVYARSTWVIVPVTGAVTYGLFHVYSGAFEFRWSLAILMGVNVWLYTTSTMLGNLLVAEGTRGVRWSMYGAFVTAAVNVGASLWLIPPYGVGGTMVATLLAFVVAVSVRAFALGRLL